MKATTRAGVLGAALLMAMSTVAPAHAARQSSIDAANDVLKGSCVDAECSDYVETVDATHTDGDIRGLVTNHGTSSVVIRASFASLTAYRDFRFLDVKIATNEGVSREAVVFFEPDAPTQGHRLFYNNNKGTEATCTGLSSKADYTYETITVTVPRSCLSYPQSVRTGAVYGRWTDNEVDFIDDARLNGRVGEAPVLGTGVAKG